MPVSLVGAVSPVYHLASSLLNKLHPDVNSEAKWYTGETAPTSETGNDGDFYFDLTTNKTYYKQDGEWKEKVSSNSKDISKIEKVTNGINSNTYKITYADGSTETFEVEKEADLIDQTQEELFEEFKTISANSMAKPYYSSIYRTDVGEINYTYIKATTDENGYYYSSSYDAGERTFVTYYFKAGDKYVEYSNGSGEPKSTYITQEEWQNEQKNIIQDLNESYNGDTVTFELGLFTAQTLDEAFSRVRWNLSLAYDDGLTAKNPTIRLTKQLDEEINKEKLLLQIKYEVADFDGNSAECEYVIECYSNEIKAIKDRRRGISQSGEVMEATASYTFEYFTDITMVPSADVLESLLPTE